MEENYKEIDLVLPSSELHVALYLQYLIGTVKHHSTIESAYYGIKWARNRHISLETSYVFWNCIFGSGVYDSVM
jgi:hypothetical protein